MAPLSPDILQGLASRNATDAMTPTLFPRQYLPIPPYFAASHSSTSPSEAGPVDMPELDNIVAVSMGVVLYVCLIFVVAMSATFRYNSRMYPSPSKWTWAQQSAGFLALFSLALPLIFVHGCLQLLVRAFLRYLSIPTNAEASGTGSVIAISSSPSESTLSPYFSSSSDSSSSVENRRAGSGGILRKALVKYVGLFPLREGKLSWPEQNERESEPLRQQRRQRMQAAHNRQADENIARLEAELAPPPAYDGVVLPQYERESRQRFVVVPLHDHQGELRRSRGGLVRQSAVIGDNRDETTRASSQDLHDQMSPPPPAYC